MEKMFNFSTALYFLRSGYTICLSLDSTTREYFLDEEGRIQCRVGKTTYPIKCFYVDAIMSNDWFLKNN